MHPTNPRPLPPEFPSSPHPPPPAAPPPPRTVVEDHLPTYAQSQAANPRFTRWGPWIEKRASERQPRPCSSVTRTSSDSHPDSAAPPSALPPTQDYIRPRSTSAPSSSTRARPAAHGLTRSSLVERLGSRFDLGIPHEPLCAVPLPSPTPTTTFDDHHHDRCVPLDSTRPDARIAHLPSRLSSSRAASSSSAPPTVGAAFLPRPSSHTQLTPPRASTRPQASTSSTSNPSRPRPPSRPRRTPPRPPAPTSSGPASASTTSRCTSSLPPPVPVPVSLAWTRPGGSCSAWSTGPPRGTSRSGCGASPR